MNALRAFCIPCGTFSVLPETRRCERCGAPIDRRLEFVDILVAGGDNSKPEAPTRRRRSKAKRLAEAT